MISNNFQNLWLKYILYVFIDNCILNEKITGRCIPNPTGIGKFLYASFDG